MHVALGEWTCIFYSFIFKVEMFLFGRKFGVLVSLIKKQNKNILLPGSQNIIVL